ncbi:hypothetical protein ACYOEI_26725, partial [Singulisphaera rosea]
MITIFVLFVAFVMNPLPLHQGAKKHPRDSDESRGCSWKIPAITDFRAKGTIMGLAGLTAVFGMGT